MSIVAESPSAAHWYGVSGQLATISVGSAGNIWGINSTGLVYRFLGSWSQINQTLSQVSVGSDGTVWGIDTNGVIWRYDNGIWREIAGPVTQIAVGSASQVWGVDSNGNVYQYTGSDWNMVDGQLFQVAVGADGTVWGLTGNGVIYRRDNGMWTKIDGQLSQIAVGSALQVWGVASDGKIYQYTGSDWNLVKGKLSQVAVGADGIVWGLYGEQIFYYVHEGILSISNPHLEERDLDPGESAKYQFQIMNNLPGIVIRSLQLDLGYDREIFRTNGLTVHPDVLECDSVFYGVPVEMEFTLTASENATVGTYGFFEVRASYTIQNQQVPIQSDAGGWMTFPVTPD